MLNELTMNRHDEAVTSSLLVAEKFRKRHADVLKKIDNLVKDLKRTQNCVGSNEDTPAQNCAEQKMFFRSYYTDAHNEHRPVYYMNRDGFSLLVMGFTGSDALKWKLNYIKAFNEMELFIKEKTSSSWIESRESGKLTRHELTDTIQQLISYAQSQGSTNTKFFYATYTRLANKISGITDRDLASIRELNHLEIVEELMLDEIEKGMRYGMDYHDIYQNCKERLEQFQALTRTTRRIGVSA